MGSRSRLLVAALASGVLTGIVGLVGVLPVVRALRAELQARYDDAAAFPEAARVVTTEYHQAALWTVVAVAVVLFCAGAAFVAATTPPARRREVPRDLGRLAAVLLVAQAPLSVAADRWGSYSSTATVGGLVLGAAGLAVPLLERGPRWARVAGCLLAAAATTGQLPRRDRATL